MNDRDNKAFDIRRDAADLAKNRRGSDHPTNGEEKEYENANYIANFTKGLKHHDNGEVIKEEYEKLLKALNTGKQEDFDDIEQKYQHPNKVRLTNPQAGFAFDLEGPDSHDMGIRKAPKIDGAEVAGEMAELYWMVLCRDIPFMEFGSNGLITNAVNDLHDNYSDFPHVEVGFLTNIGNARGDDIFSEKFDIRPENREITKETIFRGITEGDIKGPYISQFLWKDIPWGSQKLEQLQYHLNMYDINNTQQGKDYLTDYAGWLKIQNGGKDEDLAHNIKYNHDDVDTNFKRHILTGRDLSYFVHVDQLYQTYLNACLILLGNGQSFDPLLPYDDKTKPPNEK